MFQVYSNAGRVFSRSLEQRRQVAPTSALARNGFGPAPQAHSRNHHDLL